MATFRKNLLKFVIETDGKAENANDTTDEEQEVIEANVLNNSPVHSDEDDDEHEDIEDLGLEDVVEEKNEAAKQKRKAGRKATWPESFVNETVSMICENEYYRRKLIFTNNKASKNLAIYEAIVKELKKHFTGFSFTPIQLRTKFKACVAACKKASMMRRCGSGISNFMDQKPIWFKKLFPFVESRDSCDPNLALEPSFQVISSETSFEENNATSPSSSSPATPNNEQLFVPRPSKRAKKDTPTSLLKEAVTAFNKFAATNPTESLKELIKEENEKSRQHEMAMMEMQNQMFQTMFSSLMQQEQMVRQNSFYNEVSANQNIISNPNQAARYNNSATWMAYINRDMNSNIDN